MHKIILFLFLFVITNASAQEIPKWKVSDLQSAIKSADKPTIFNFWATFCKPCIEEIPWFQEMVKKYDSAGIQLVLVNLDMSETYSKLRPFALKRGFLSLVYFLDETNADLFCPVVDESWSGAMPASLFVNNKTGYHQFYGEQLSKQQLEAGIIEMIKPLDKSR
jgi:thiol-disulfide isomerase/thioredoxin